MRAYSRCLLVMFALLIVGAAWAQEHRPSWLGVELQDLTKEEADRLGWEAPRGAKLGVVVPGSPADKAGLKTGDIITAVDRGLVDTSSDVEDALGHGIFTYAVAEGLAGKGELGDKREITTRKTACAPRWRTSSVSAPWRRVCCYRIGLCETAEVVSCSQCLIVGQLGTKIRVQADRKQEETSCSVR